MTGDKLKLWLDFSKFLLGTVVVGLVSLWINSGIETRQIELKEMEEIGKFVEYAIDENVATRMRFAQYFSVVVRSDLLRERWEAYSELLDEELRETEERLRQAESQEEALEGAIRRGEGDRAQADLEATRADLQELRSELNVTPRAEKLLGIESRARGTLVVSRAATLLEEAHSDARVLAKLRSGEVLLLLDDGRQTNGYFHAVADNMGAPITGWIYRTLVRRY